MFALAFSILAGAQATYDPALWSGMRYRMIGPERGGRVTAVTGVPSEPYTFYMGSTGGGVWKTTDAGHTWTNVSDGFFSVASMGAIEVSLSNPNVVYAGTGSSKIRSNVSIGRGIYKSIDAGKTWTFLGLRDVGQIATVRVHPVESRHRVRGRQRQSVRPQQGARRLSLHRWRQDVEAGVLPFRQRRRGRSGASARKPERDFRLHVARAAQAVDHHQRRARRRHLQEHRRRRYLDQARGRAAQRTVRPQQRGYLRGQPQSHLRAHRGQARFGPVPLRRCGRHLVPGQRLGQHHHAAVLLHDARRGPQQSRRGLGG